jgi:hypothetical protein
MMDTVATHAAGACSASLGSIKITRDVQGYSARVGSNERRALKTMPEAERGLGTETLSPKFEKAGDGFT